MVKMTKGKPATIEKTVPVGTKRLDLATFCWVVGEMIAGGSWHFASRAVDRSNQLPVQTPND
jgi:hypothetical protein